MIKYPLIVFPAQRTAHMNEFLTFLGKKVSLRGFSDGQLVTNERCKRKHTFFHEIVLEGAGFSIYAEFKEDLQLLFHVSSCLPSDSRKSQIFSQSVVLAFLDDCTTLDLSIFYSKETSRHCLSPY